jgi:Ca-activated chloride channel family protein
LVKPNKEELSKIGNYIPMTVSDEDVKTLFALTPNIAQDNKKDASLITEQATMWKDWGPYLLYLAIPFFVWLFRKGVFFAILIILPLTTEAGIFEREDQTAYRKTMSGVEAYRIGNFEAAKQVFEMGQSADELYNAGNAKAHLNDIQGAIQSYEKALQINPQHAYAKWNKEYLEKQLPPQQENQDNNQSDENQDNKSMPNESNQTDNKTDNQNNESNSNNNQNESDGDTSQNQDKQNQSPENNQSDNVSSSENQPQTENQENQSEEETNQQSSYPMEETQNTEEMPEGEAQQNIPENNKQFDQESEQLLNKIKQDPSRLLRYRLYQQYIRKPQ